MKEKETATQTQLAQPKRIAILGSTGSIGTQALEVVAFHADQYEAYLLSANTNATLLIEQARRFLPEVVVIGDERKFQQVRASLADLPIKVYAGEEALCQAMADEQIDLVLTAIVGYAGLRPTISAIEHGHPIALANKETLVVAGELVTQLLARHAVGMIPVDSEHSAIFQCLNGEWMNQPSKIILTASGGPFRGYTPQELAKVTKAQALKHPNWSMGAKITIDSATMMNKGFEVIEARWLFDLPAEKIEVVVHPQSIVHSMVEFADGALKAQLGTPDMRLPIQYAFSYPERLPLPGERLTLDKYACLTFEAPNTETFPCLTLAYEALSRGGTAACAMNAANEIAVAAFLQEQISFVRIPQIIEQTMAKAPFTACPTYEDYVQTDGAARRIAAELMP